MKKLICFLVGHKFGDINDSGYDICSRCGYHDYYDRDFSILHLWTALTRKLFSILYATFYKIKFKFEKDDDLPF